MEIKTLVPDIYRTITSKSGWFTPELNAELSAEIAVRLQSSLGEERDKPRLRMSGLGPQCPRALWYSIYHPELAIPYKGWERIKFGYGHILEALAIALAKASGHDVKGEQDELELDGVTGHRDCVIDGCIVDVKSSTSFGMQKLKDGTLWQDDKFGYLDQLDSYVVASAEDPLVTVKDKAYILGIDKQLGHMVLYQHDIREESIRQRIRDYKSIVSLDRPPECTCEQVPEGKSGNYRLGVKASYSAYKYCCFPHLRTFLYSSGPVYFTKLVKRPQPHIVEINKDGKVVYN